MPNISEIPVPQAKYSLLQKDPKGCWYKNKPTIIIGLLSALGAFLILAIYIPTIGIYDLILFPRTTGNKDFPEQWLNRAILYNNVNNYNNTNTTVVLYGKQNINNIDNYKMVCYYSLPNPNSLNALLPEDIDPDLCTHINIAFASIKNSSIYMSDYQLNISESVMMLKTKNANLKILLSIGGANNNKGFPEMVTNHTNRKKFIRSINFNVRHYKFDGIDLDWEFPNDKKERMHFTQLLHEIRREIDRQDKYKFLLSVAVAAPSFIVDNSYDVSYMNEYVDFINLMSYDFHFFTKFTPFTGLNAPLYSANEVGYFATLNINYSANYWHAKGMEKTKIIVGLPTYGHSFKLVNPNNNGINAPARGYGNLGSNGFIDFADACWFLSKNQIKPFFDTDAKSPYATKYTEWISYDDQTSITFKAEYIKNNHFGGAMVLSLNTDDHHGYCRSNGKNISFPLTKTIKSILNDQLL